MISTKRKTGHIAKLAIITFCIASIALGETVQIADKYFDDPYALSYINYAMTASMCLFILPIWRYYRWQFNLSTNILKQQTDCNPYIWFITNSILMGIVYGISGILFRKSMNGNTITVPTSNAISGMAPIPTFILSVLFLKQKVTLSSILAMCMALIGILLFVFEIASRAPQTNQETYDTYFGIILTITWTVGYSVGGIILKKTFQYIEKDQFIIGGILIYAILSFVVATLFWWTLLYPETVTVNSFTSSGVLWIVISALVAFSLHTSMNVAIALTSPFYLGIVSQLVIPMTFFVDVFVHNYKFNAYAMFGALFIIASFLILEIKPNYNKIYSFFGYYEDAKKIKPSTSAKDVNHENCTNESVKGLLTHSTEKSNNYGTISQV